MHPITLREHPILDELGHLSPAELDEVIEANLAQVMEIWDEADAELRKQGPMYCMIEQLNIILRARLLRRMRASMVSSGPPPIDASVPTIELARTRGGQIIQLMKGSIPHAST